MTRYPVEVVPFQHGYESESYHCWALVWDHPCTRGARVLADNVKLCGQHAAQREREGMSVVRLGEDGLRRCLADIDRESRAERGA